MDNITNKREKINNIDKELVSLLYDRIELCKEIGILKKKNNINVLDKNRENEIIKNLANNSYFNQEEIKNIYNEIFILSKKKQLEITNN